MGVQNLKISDNKVIKTFKSNITYNRELLIYKHNLSYTPKMISYNDSLKEIILEKEPGLTLVQIPMKEREKYYKKSKELYYKFLEDTGYYLYDFHPGNIIINTTEGESELKLIDFEYIGKDKKIKHRKCIENFLNKINVF